jgi:hypothetical protein
VSAHNLPGETPVLFLRCAFPGGVTMNDADGDPGAIDFVECGLEPDAFRIESFNPGSVIRVQSADGSSFEMTSAGVRDIGAFYPY